MKLWLKLKIMFINFQTLPDIFENLIALNARLKQNQWQLFSSTTLIKHSQSENDVKEVNAGQQLKKSKNEKISVPDQHKEWTDDKSKKNVTCYQCNKKGHYKLQYSELTKKQLKNVNQALMGEVHVKRKNQHSQKTSQAQNEEQ